MKNNSFSFRSLRHNSYLLLFWRLGMVMLAFQVCRVLFYVYNQTHFPDMTGLHLVELMGVGFKFDLTATLYTNLLFIAGWILPFPWRFRKGYRQGLKIIFLATNGLAMLANLADFVYFRFSLRRTDFEVFKEFAGEIEWMGILGATLLEHWVLVLLFLGLMGFFALAYGRVEPSPWEKKPLHFYLVSGVLFPVLLGLMVGGIRGGFRATRPIKISNAAYKVKQVSEIAIVLNTPFSIYLSSDSDFFRRVEDYAPEELDRRYNPVHPGAPEGSFRAKNVVVIILESFSKEYSGFFNDSIDGLPFAGYTPFLDSLAAHSLTFDYAFASGQKSIDAIYSILGSIPSLVQPFAVSKYAINQIEGLGDILRKKGYEAAFFHGAPNGSMGFNAMANMVGLDQYYGKDEFGDDRFDDGIWGIYDLEFLQYYAREMNGMQEPFITSVFTVTSHHPFKLPPGFENRFPKGEVPMIECVGYTDYALKKFFETASRMPWYENTLFVITADHSRFSDQWEEYRTPMGVFSVPVLFFEPSGALAFRDDVTLFQHIDILPTVLGYLGFDAPFFAFGRDYFSSRQEPFVINFANHLFQYTRGSHTLLFDGSETRAMYDIRRDKQMKTNLADSLPEARNDLEAEAKAVIQQYINRMIDDNLKP